LGCVGAIAQTSFRNEIADRYVAAFTSNGSTSYIENLETKVGTFNWAGHVLPITINDGGRAHTFVCSPLVGYVDYTLEEFTRFPNQSIVPVLKAIVRSVGMGLSLADANRIVHVNNWMVSTNLPFDLDPKEASSNTQALVRQFPEHILAIRSLNREHSGDFMRSLDDAGWLLVPSRQVYLVQDVLNESLSRRDSKNDQQVFEATHLTYEELQTMSERDAQGMARRYEQLYLEKYSRLNPAFTAQFIKLTHSLGMIRYLVFRDPNGEIVSFGGMYHCGAHATMPLMGYDTRAAQQLGLYRLACHAGSLYAARNALQLNMSSGAATYKRTRGAKPEIEYTAYYVRHLPGKRRLPFQVLNAIANRVGVPVLRRYEL
jgi:hypothetical protein